MPLLNGFTLEAASHLIQAALTPVFLLSGIAALLNVFAGRLARVADRIHIIADAAQSPEREAQLAELHRRSLTLDVAVALATAGAAATCAAILTLFLFALSNKVLASVLLGFFGLSIVCTLGSVIAFGVEMLLSSQGLRRQLRFHLPHLPWPSRASTNRRT